MSNRNMERWQFQANNFTHVGMQLTVETTHQVFFLAFLLISFFTCFLIFLARL